MCSTSIYLSAGRGEIEPVAGLGVYFVFCTKYICIFRFTSINTWCPHVVFFRGDGRCVPGGCIAGFPPNRSRLLVQVASCQRLGYGIM